MEEKVFKNDTKWLRKKLKKIFLKIFKKTVDK